MTRMHRHGRSKPCRPSQSPAKAGADTFTCPASSSRAPPREGRLKPGDFLVFYCGLQEWDCEGGWNCDHRLALYLAGYFEVALTGMAGSFENRALATEFGRNFHFRYPA